MMYTEWKEDTTDPKGWYMTEKYEGLRLYWNGTEFYTIQGDRVNAPASIAQQLPNIKLDGVLWTQYGLYQGPLSVTRTENEEHWTKAIFWVFDAPHIGDKPLEVIQGLFEPNSE